MNGELQKVQTRDHLECFVKKRLVNSTSGRGTENLAGWYRRGGLSQVEKQQLQLGALEWPRKENSSSCWLLQGWLRRRGEVLAGEQQVQLTAPGLSPKKQWNTLCRTSALTGCARSCSQGEVDCPRGELPRLENISSSWLLQDTPQRRPGAQVGEQQLQLAAPGLASKERYSTLGKSTAALAFLLQDSFLRKRGVPKV